MTGARPRPYALPVPCPLGRPGARRLGAGPFGFVEVDVLHRGQPAERLPADAARALYPELAGMLVRAEGARPAIAGLDLGKPRIMGIVNVTPDSFSDGGRLPSAEAAVAHGLALAEAGADILDVGGESTRPGARTVPVREELDRVLDVITGLAGQCATPISIDTRKAAVAQAALAAGARIVNDVSALSFDEDMALVAQGAEGLCLMHALGPPQTMQDDPSYDHVLLDVYDALERRVGVAEAAGIARERLIVDPGIGFGKTLEHNLALIRGLALFHGLGAAVLVGASRKAFIGRLSGIDEAGQRVAGSVAAALAALGRGAQIVRVHDVAETAEAMRVWQAIEGGG